MKTKKKLMITLMSFATSMLAFVGLTSLSQTTASANGAFSVADVASIKVDESGIRFYAFMDEATKAQAEEDGFGFLIFPQSYYTSIENFDYANIHTTLENHQVKEITGDKTKIYKYDDTQYAVNAVLTNLHESSFDIEFTCVAYVGSASDGYTYAYDETLAKSVYNIASQAVVNTEETSAKIDKILTTYGEESVYDFATATKPVKITDEEQVYGLNKLVGSGRNYENINFKVENDVTVDCYGLTKSISGFEGAFVESESKINLVNGAAKDMEHAFANCETNCGICNPIQSLLSVTSKTPSSLLKQYSETGNNDSRTATCVANADIPAGYNGDALSIHMASRYNLYITLNYTRTEIESWKGKYEVELNYYFTGECTYTGGIIGEDDVTQGQWCKKRIKITDLLNYIGTGVVESESTLYLYCGWSSKLYIYIGDINLVEVKLFEVALATTSSLKLSDTSEWKNTKASRVLNADLPNNTGYDGDAMAITVKSGQYVHVTLRYTKAEIAALKDFYESVTIPVMYVSTNTVNAPNGGLFEELGVAKPTKNTWINVVVDMDTLYEWIGEFTLYNVIEETVGNEKRLPLTKSYSTGNYTFYLGDITFNPKQA